MVSDKGSMGSDWRGLSVLCTWHYQVHERHEEAQVAHAVRDVPEHDFRSLANLAPGAAGARVTCALLGNHLVHLSSDRQGCVSQVVCLCVTAP